MTSVRAAAPIPPALQLLAAKRPLVIGHRGACELAPENTLPSFKLALEAKADLVELDCQRSRDGALMVVHDATLDRTTDATRRWRGKRISVASKTAPEIQSLDAGRWFDPKFAGTKVPQLTEALELIQGSGGVTVIERKSGDAASCATLLAHRKWINHVVVLAFDWQYLKTFHRLQPEQILGALGPPEILTDGAEPPRRPKAFDETWLDLLQATGAKVVVWNKQVGKESVEQAHRRGLKVWIYTVNSRQLAKQLLDFGVDGLITNNPLQMRRFVLSASRLHSSREDANS